MKEAKESKEISGTRIMNGIGGAIASGGRIGTGDRRDASVRFHTRR